MFKYILNKNYNMANSTLLESIGKKSVNEIRKDLLEMLRIGTEMDRYYAESNSDVDIYMKKFNKLVKSFNKKYKGLMLKLITKPNSVELKIFLNEKKVKDVFANSASKIMGVQSIGASNFGVAIVSEPEKFNSELEKAKNKLYITYYNPETGTSNVFLQSDKKIKRVQLVYELEDMENEPSAEFQIAAYYALSQGYTKKINLHDEAITFGFSLFPDYLVKRKYLDKYDPHLSE